MATKEVDQLLFQLHRTQNLLQARMEDVGELAGRVNDFADKNAILRKTVKLLQAQLVIVESGAHRKVLGMQRLNKLKEQVRNLEEKSKAALYYNHNTASTTAAARHSNNHNGRSGQDRRSVEFDSDVSSVDNERCGAKDETTFESETATSVGEHSFLEPHLPITLVPSREATYSRYANIVNTACREQVAPANIPAHNGGNAGRSNNTTASTGPTGSATQAAPISHIGTTNASSTSPASASPSIAVAARPTSSSASGASPTSFSSREGALNGAENVDNSAPGAALNRSSPLPMETAVNGEVSPIAARSPALALAPQIERRRLHEELAAEPADPTTPDTVSSAGSVASTRSPFGPAQSAVPTSTPPSRPQQQPTQQQEQYISLVASPAWGRSRFLSPMGSVDSYQSAGGNNNSASRVVAYEDIYATHSADDYDCLRMSDSLRESVGMDVSPQQSSHALGDATAELRASGGERADTGASTSSAGDGDRAGDGDAAAGGSRGDRGGREGHRTDSGHFAPQLLDIYGRQSSVFSMLESESSRSDLDLDLQEGSSAAVGVTRGNAQQQQAVSSSPDQRLADTGISFDDLTYSHTNSTASMMIPSSPQGVTQASQTQAGSRMFGVNPLALKPQRRKSVS